MPDEPRRLRNAQLQPRAEERFLKLNEGDQEEVNRLVALLRKDPSPDGLTKYEWASEIIVHKVCVSRRVALFYDYDDDTVYIKSIRLFDPDHPLPGLRYLPDPPR